MSGKQNKPIVTKRVGKRFGLGVITTLSMALIMSMLLAALVANEKISENTEQPIAVIILIAATYIGAKVVLQNETPNRILISAGFTLAVLFVIASINVILFDCTYKNVRYTVIGIIVGSALSVLRSGRGGGKLPQKQKRGRKRLYNVHSK